MTTPPNNVEIPPIGSAIREQRRRRRLTQEELAQLTGLQRAYIGDIELKVRNVSLRTLVRIAVALEMKVSHLLAVAESKLESEEGMLTDTLPEGAD